MQQLFFKEIGETHMQVQNKDFRLLSERLDTSFNVILFKLNLFCPTVQG